MAITQCRYCPHPVKTNPIPTVCKKCQKKLEEDFQMMQKQADPWMNRLLAFDMTKEEESK